MKDKAPIACANRWMLLQTVNFGIRANACEPCFRKARNDMCEAHAFLLKNGIEEKILESVDTVEFEGDDVKMVSIFGEQKTVKGVLKSYDGTEGKILIEPLS